MPLLADKEPEDKELADKERLREFKRVALLKQIGAITWWNLRSIPARLGTSMVICVGIAGVVAVLITVLAMATGLQGTIGSAGREDRAVVLRSGAQAEVVSALDRDVEFALAQAPGVRQLDDGKPAISPEIVLSVTLPNREGRPVGIGLRGLTPAAWDVRPELKIVAGRTFRTGLQEVLVGHNALGHLPGLALGDTLPMYGKRWTVVGVFTSAGDVHESELLADAGMLMSAAQRTVYSAATVVLSTPDQLQAFKAQMQRDPRLKVEVQRETAYYAKQSKDVSKLLFVIAYVVGGVMALGALFGALNTMYAAVSARSMEIATLRAIGFGAWPVVFSVLVESMLLSTLGAIGGATIAWAVFSGEMFSTADGGFAQIALRMHIGIDLVLIGMLWGAAIGLLGGLLPAIRAARLSVASALRAG